MSTTYHLVYAAGVLPGFEPAAVRAALGARLKLDEAQLAALFSGRRAVIKRGLDLQKAQQWVQRFAALGAQLSMEEDVAAAAPVASVAATSAPAGLSLVPMAAVAMPPSEPEPAATRLPEPAPAPQFDAGTKAEARGDMDAPSSRQGFGSTRHAPPPRDFRSWAHEDEPALFGTSMEGRVGRLRYTSGILWMLVIFLAILTVALRSIGIVSGLVFLISAVAFLFLTIRLNVLRLHDLNLTGWWAVLSVVPTVGTIMTLVLMFWPGNPDDNDYGPRPEAGSVMSIVIAILVLVAVGALLLWSSIRMLGSFFGH